MESFSGGQSAKSPAAKSDAPGWCLPLRGSPLDLQVRHTIIIPTLKVAEIIDIGLV